MQKVNARRKKGDVKPSNLECTVGLQNLLKTSKQVTTGAILVADPLSVGIEGASWRDTEQ